ncbi:MAG TPA: hypothetical protein PKY96_05135 [Flavobacteriales bacterium]|nr:hypothetical protein [Flavobacteriales bacterium]
MRATIILFSALLLAACNSGGEAEATAEQSSTATSLAVDLSGHNIPFSIELGDANTLGVDSPTVRWNEEFGHLSVQAGERFSILITEEPGDIARMKADLNRDPLRTNSVVEEQPDRIIWRSAFPDEDIVFVHFYRVVQVDGRTFVVQDDDRGRFNEADAARMMNSVRTKQPV